MGKSSSYLAWVMVTKVKILLLFSLLYCLSLGILHTSIQPHEEKSVTIDHLHRSAHAYLWVGARQQTYSPYTATASSYCNPFSSMSPVNWTSFSAVTANQSGEIILRITSHHHAGEGEWFDGQTVFSIKHQPLVENFHAFEKASRRIFWGQ